MQGDGGILRHHGDLAAARIARSCLLLSSSSSVPSSRIEPLVRAPAGNSPNNDSAVMVLPLPLSPAMPSTSPASTAKDTPSTAL